MQIKLQLGQYADTTDTLSLYIYEGATLIESGNLVEVTGADGLFLANFAENYDYDKTYRAIIKVNGVSVADSLYYGTEYIGEEQREQLFLSDYPTIYRSEDDTGGIVFSWQDTGSSIDCEVSINNGAYTPCSGTASYFRSEDGVPFYILSYDSGDRPGPEESARYKLSDGTLTKYLNLRVTAGLSSVKADLLEIKTDIPQALSDISLVLDAATVYLETIEGKVLPLPADPAEESSISAVSTIIEDIKEIADKLDSMIEQSGPQYRFDRESLYYAIEDILARMKSGKRVAY